MTFFPRGVADDRPAGNDVAVTALLDEDEINLLAQATFQQFTKQLGTFDSADVR